MKVTGIIVALALSMTASSVFAAGATDAAEATAKAGASAVDAISAGIKAAPGVGATANTAAKAAAAAAAAGRTSTPTGTSNLLAPQTGVLQQAVAKTRVNKNDYAPQNLLPISNPALQAAWTKGIAAGVVDPANDCGQNFDKDAQASEAAAILVDEEVNALDCSTVSCASTASIDKGIKNGDIRLAKYFGEDVSATTQREVALAGIVKQAATGATCVYTAPVAARVSTALAGM